MGGPEPPELLDCTIRDGSYAIDFKFTAADTALIAGSLEQIGIRWIEVGHGLGLGASEAGKGAAASHDLEVIEATRARVRAAKIGAFFIPGIGTEEHLRAAAAAGLDFVRVGQNADEIIEAMPYVELARSLGMQAFVNFMKTYGISPADFAAGARRAEEAGAIGVYAVDSAGGMVPHEVASYVEAARAAAPIPVGFHGHSNLHLAVANSLAAWEAGATWIDTSLYGIGRSSGNVPTEVMVAVLSRLGVDCGIDPSDVIDVAEQYLRPLAEHLHPHDMVAVSLGLGQFHSSFLPRALAAAEEAGINPFRLIVELGRRNVMELPDELLGQVVDQLRDRAPVEVRRDVAAFADSRFGPRTISNRPGAVADLLDSLEVVAAKRRLAIVIDLALAPMIEEEAVTAEFVLEDETAAIGRIRFGSLDAACRALETVETRLELCLLNIDSLDSTTAGPALQVFGSALSRPVLPYRSSTLELDYLAEVVFASLALPGAPKHLAIVDPGQYEPAQVADLARGFSPLASLISRSEQDPNELDALTVVAGPLGSVTATPPVIALGAGRWTDVKSPSGVVVLDCADAYRGRLSMWRRVVAAARLSDTQPVR